MAPVIQELSADTTLRLGAGVMASSPFAIVKELVDNAIDASATSIEILISADTITKIEIRDNGSGIHKDDFNSLGRRSHTSKLRSFDELRYKGGMTLGFRGEALSSMATIGHLVITTRTAEEKVAHVLEIIPRRGGIASRAVRPAPVGTTVVVTGLFAEFPVRRTAWLKGTKKTLEVIKKMLYASALARPRLRLSLRVFDNPRGAWSYCPDNRVPGPRGAALQIFGSDLVSQCIFEVSGGKAASVDDGAEAAKAAEAAEAAEAAKAAEAAEAAKGAEAGPRGLARGWLDKSTRSGRDSGIGLEVLWPLPNADPKLISGTGCFISVDSRPVSSNRGLMRRLCDIYRRSLHAALRQTRGHGSKSLVAPFLQLNITCPLGTYDPNIEALKDAVLFENEKSLLDQFTAMCRKTYAVDSDNGPGSGGLSQASFGRVGSTAPIPATPPPSSRLLREETESLFIPRTPDPERSEQIRETTMAPPALPPLSQPPHPSSLPSPSPSVGRLARMPERIRGFEMEKPGQRPGQKSLSASTPAWQPNGDTTPSHRQERYIQTGPSYSQEPTSFQPPAPVRTNQPSVDVSETGIGEAAISPEEAAAPLHRQDSTDSLFGDSDESESESDTTLTVGEKEQDLFSGAEINARTIAKMSRNHNGQDQVIPSTLHERRHQSASPTSVGSMDSPGLPERGATPASTEMRASVEIEDADSSRPQATPATRSPSDDDSIFGDDDFLFARSPQQKKQQQQQQPAAARSHPEPMSDTPLSRPAVTANHDRATGQWIRQSAYDRPPTDSSSSLNRPLLPLPNMGQVQQSGESSGQPPQQPQLPLPRPHRPLTGGGAATVQPGHDLRLGQQQQQQGQRQRQHRQQQPTPQATKVSEPAPKANGPKKKGKRGILARLRDAPDPFQLPVGIGGRQGPDVDSTNGGGRESEGDDTDDQHDDGIFQGRRQRPGLPDRTCQPPMTTSNHTGASLPDEEELAFGSEDGSPIIQMDEMFAQINGQARREPSPPPVGQGSQRHQTMQQQQQMQQMQQQQMQQQIQQRQSEEENDADPRRYLIRMMANGADGGQIQPESGLLPLERPVPGYELQMLHLTIDATTLRLEERLEEMMHRPGRCQDMYLLGKGLQTGNITEDDTDQLTPKIMRVVQEWKDRTGITAEVEFFI